METVISVANLCKRYGGLKAVDDISFSIQRGEIFGLIGPNGAGKTTTVEILSGLRSPDHGDVRVLGLDPQHQAAALRQRVGVQLQQAALPEEIRVGEALNLFASFYKHAHSWQDLLETWGLAEKRKASFRSLSGGQRQRLFIALALVNDPELVFLDEITTGLDPQARLATWDLVRSIRDSGKTVVLVTHFMDEAQRLCDRVGVVDHGHLVACDAPDQLIQALDAGLRVHFTSSNGFDPACLARLPGVTRIAHAGDEVTIYGKGPLLVHVAAALSELGQVPADLRSEQASLEDVFLCLTGRKIRE